MPRELNLWGSAIVAFPLKADKLCPLHRFWSGPDDGVEFDPGLEFAFSEARRL